MWPLSGQIGLKQKLTETKITDKKTFDDLTRKTTLSDLF